MGHAQMALEFMEEMAHGIPGGHRTVCRLSTVFHHNELHGVGRKPLRNRRDLPKKASGLKTTLEPAHARPFAQPLRQRPLGVLDGEREVGVPRHGFALRGHSERH